MFEEAQLYSPVTENEDGSVTVELAGDHPGASDPVYRERRNHIAARAVAWTPGEPIPRIEYADDEHEVWRIVCRELAPKHEKYACRDFRDAAHALALPTDHIPQLDEVTDGRSRPSRAGRTTPRPAWSPCATSSARSATASSTRPSTSGTARCRSTRPSRI